MYYTIIHINKKISETNSNVKDYQIPNMDTWKISITLIWNRNYYQIKIRRQQPQHKKAKSFAVPKRHSPRASSLPNVGNLTENGDLTADGLDANTFTSHRRR